MLHSVSSSCRQLHARKYFIHFFLSNFHAVKVVLYGAKNILSLGTTEIFHFGGDKGRFL